MYVRLLPFMFLKNCFYLNDQFGVPTKETGISFYIYLSSLHDAGQPNLPSENRELRKVAHLTGLYLGGTWVLGKPLTGWVLCSEGVAAFW